MKKLPTIFISVLLIALFVKPSQANAAWWNPFSWFKKAPVAVVVPSVQQTAPSDFEKKLACSKLQPTIQQQVTQYNQSQKVQVTPETATDRAGNYLFKEMFYQIFYSPKLDTCMDVIVSQSLVQYNNEFVPINESYMMNDALTGKMIDWIDTVKHGSTYYSVSDVDKKITDYQSQSSVQIMIGQPDK